MGDCPPRTFGTILRVHRINLRFVYTLPPLCGDLANKFTLAFAQRFLLICFGILRMNATKAIHDSQTCDD
jgi:hypothetical protein